MTIDIKNFYLATLLSDHQCMFLPAEIILEEIRIQCNLHAKIHYNKIHIRIDKGIYRLKEAGALGNKELQEHLKLFGYSPAKFTPGLWKHLTKDIIFTLVADDFGAKHTKKSDVEHLIQALRSKCDDAEVNWKGDKLCGITLN